jgi:hypothetical protein
LQSEHESEHEESAPTLADLLQSVEYERKNLSNHSTTAAVNFHDDDEDRKPRRCAGFPYHVPKAVFGDLERLGYVDWIGRRIKSSSKAAIIQQTAQFIVFCTLKLKPKLK